MIVGFTGTGKGMTPAQLARVKRYLLVVGAHELHYGDCVGADAQAHLLAVAMGLRTVQHPPDDPKARAFTLADEVRPEKPYRYRNYDIVDESEWLIATPYHMKEIQRSGTWMTVRYARRKGRPFTIIWPDGSMGDGTVKIGGAPT